MHQHLRRRIVPGLGERLTALRRAAGLSQQVCATRAQISTNRLRDAETYDAATTATLNQLARVFGVGVDALLGGGRSPGDAGATS
jgi:transcriptional regulator with XRE-family HTH domain